MYTKEQINAMRKKLIEECEKSKGKKDSAVNCSACKDRFARICASISGHPPKHMTDGEIIKLWDLSHFSRIFTAESLIAEAGRNSTVSSVQIANR